MNQWQSMTYTPFLSHHTPCPQLPQRGAQTPTQNGALTKSKQVHSTRDPAARLTAITATAWPNSERGRPYLNIWQPTTKRYKKFIAIIVIVSYMWNIGIFVGFYQLKPSATSQSDPHIVDVASVAHDCCGDFAALHHLSMTPQCTFLGVID